jgi:hypothetical protein
MIIIGPRCRTPGVERAGEAPGLALAVDDAHAPVAADVGHGPHPPVVGPRHEHQRAAQVDRHVAAGAGHSARQAEHERVPEEQDVDLLGEAIGRRVAVGAHLEQGVGEIGGALVDVVEQPAYEAVLQRLSIHGHSLAVTAVRQRRTVVSEGSLGNEPPTLGGSPHGRCPPD